MHAKLSTRERIIQAARRSFAEKGHDGVSMSEIAKSAGVKKALIYYYFPSKEDLFYEVWQYSIDELENNIFAEVDGEGRYVSKIKKLLRAYIKFITSSNDIRKIMVQEKGNLSRQDQDTWKRVKDRYMALSSRISSVIQGAKVAEEVQDNVDPDGAAELIINGFSSTEDLKRLESIQEIIWRGLVKDKGEQ